VRGGLNLARADAVGKLQRGAAQRGGALRLAQAQFRDAAALGQKRLVVGDMLVAGNARGLAIVVEGFARALPLRR
jgi:hypothetical protein